MLLRCDDEGVPIDDGERPVRADQDIGPVDVGVAQDLCGRLGTQGGAEGVGACDDPGDFVASDAQERRHLCRDGFGERSLVNACLERPDEVAPVGRIPLVWNLHAERRRHDRRVDASERGAKIDPLTVRQRCLETIATGNEREDDHRETVHAHPQVPRIGCDGSEDLRDALIVQEAGDRDGRLIEGTAAQLQEVRRRIVGDDPIDGGVHIVAKREKGDLGDVQSVVIAQTGAE